MFNNIKSLPHTGDLQTKAFQGHYLKHKELVELRNISLIYTVHFVWYDYRDYIFNNIKSLNHRSYIDFFLVSKSISKSIVDYHVIESVFNFSNHPSSSILPDLHLFSTW